MKDISSALAILSAMITPAVLILASGSLILTTSQRLSRALERARKIYGQFETLEEIKPGGEMMVRKFNMLRGQLHTSTLRSRYLQRIMGLLLIALCIFVLTSVSIGIIAFTGMQYTWIPTSLGLTGTVVMFYATILLILESRVAVNAVKEEMDYAMYLSNQLKNEI